MPKVFQKTKKKVKKSKKAVVGIIPVWCNWCNICVLGILLLMGATMFGGFDWLYTGENATDTDDDDTDTTTTPPEYLPDPYYKLAIQINGWTENDYFPDNPPPDMIFEVWEQSTYTGVGSGVWYDDLYLSYEGSPWTYSEGSEHFVYGFEVSIDMFMSDGYTLTTNDWLDTSVGAPETEYEVYLNGVYALDILLKWVVV